MIHHPIIKLLTPPPPLPPVLIHSSPRTVVHLVALHILACHLVSLHGEKRLQNDVEYLALSQDGHQVPTKAFQPQFYQRILVREFYNMFTATGRHLKELLQSLVPHVKRQFKTGDEIQSTPASDHHSHHLPLLRFHTGEQLSKTGAGGLLLTFFERST